MLKKSQHAIVIDDVYKYFTLSQNKSTTFKQAFVNMVKGSNKVNQKVLDGVSFNIDKGDFFGIIGRNGSGKSTLLKLIAGVYSPNQGSIDVRGGLTPFIELGVGFNPELSGRDNIYLNGALLGFSRGQMDAMYEEIVSFAELESFVDQKLKNYSSGMQVRLAFSIAVKAKNDILIFDEVLAVGDEAFQQKCMDVFTGYKNDPNQTVILVTHSMEQVRKFCNKAALIDNGKILCIGDPEEVSEEYSILNELSTNQSKVAKKVTKVKKQHNIIDDIISDFKISRTSYSVSQNIDVEFILKKVNVSNNIIFGINIFKMNDQYNPCHVEINSYNNTGGYDTSKIKDKKKNVTLSVLAGQLTKGKYLINYHILDANDKYKRHQCSSDTYLEFNITDSNMSKSGTFNILGEWNF